MKCLHSYYYSRPFDYHISNDAYRKLFESRDMQHFVLKIEDVTYDFTLKISEGVKMNYIIKTFKEGRQARITDNFSLDDLSESSNIEAIPKSNGVSQNEKRELLRRIFLGKSIMIDRFNISFLRLAGEVIGIPELLEIQDLTNESCLKQSEQFIFNYKNNIFYIESTIISFLFHLWTSIFKFFCFFGFFGKLLQTFWDLSGPTMIFCFFVNLLILFITMSLITLKNNLAWFFIVVIPFLLYSFYFPNIIIISIIEALERNLFLKKTFFYSHQKLISMFIKIVFDVDTLPKYINLGRLHSFVHGILFITFFLGFFANFMNDKAPRFLNVWIIIFVFYVSLIRYLLLYVLYLVHSITSLFNYPRRRFLEIGDFDDPFLCSFYLNERNWIDFFLTKGTKAKFSNKGRLFLNMLFSKTTFSILASIAVIIYMICTKTKMTAGQICITIFIGICMIFVLATRIKFPFFWMRRFLGRRLTEGKLQEIHENIYLSAQKRVLYYKLMQDKKSEDELISLSDNEEEEESLSFSDEEEYEEIQSKIDDVDYKIKEKALRLEALKWHKEATTWGKRYRWLRWTSIILVLLIFIIALVLIIVGGTTAVSTSNQPSIYEKQLKEYSIYNNNTKYSNNTKYHFLNDEYDVNLFNIDKNESFRFPLSPICYMKPKGLSITEIIALSMLANSPTPEYFSSLGRYIYSEFLSHKGEIGEDVVFVNTSFWWDKSFLSSMTLTRFKDPKLSVFSIRGTSNFQDLIADVEIWFSSAIVKVMNAFFPFVSLYSDKTIELIGVVTNLPRYAFKQFSLVEEYKNRFVDFIYEYIYGGTTKTEKNFSILKNQKINENKKVKSLPFHIDPDEDVMIIGHSLGGGLAKILSLVTGIQAVALSGPGVRFIGHFYQNKTVKNVKETIVDIVPDQDLIARVDMALGTQIPVPCKRGLNCHNSYRLICQVSVMCNTFQDHARLCEYLFDEETIDEMFEIGEVIA